MAVCLAAGLTAVMGAQAPTGAVDPARFAKLDEVIAADIADKKLPGAVVVVGQGTRSSTGRSTATGRSCQRLSR